MALLWGSGLTANPVLAQVKPTNDVTRCTLIVDPTAQRACLESSLQSRPAATFDPTVRRPDRAAQADRAGPGRGTDRAADRAGAALPAGVAPAPAPAAAKSEQDLYRERNWRLQIP